MTKLWRAATLIVLATVLVVGPASAVFATPGDDVGRDGRPADTAPDPRGNGGFDPARGVVDTEPEEPVDDTVTDRVPVRDRDRDMDRAKDRATDRVRDRITDRPERPECDRETDRVRDCEDHPEVRPALKRCVHYVQNHTDLEIRRHLRWWWHVCHRIL